MHDHQIERDINELKDAYTGGPSTLCPGCGHDRISNVIVASEAWENGTNLIDRQDERDRLLLEDPAHYLGQSHGFNTVHGSTSSVTTGAPLR